MSSTHNSLNNLAISKEGLFLLDAMNRKFDELKTLIRQNSPVPEREFYTPNEVCRKLSISRSKFEQMKRDGLFRTVKPIGTGKVLVAAQDLKDLFPKQFS